MDVVVIPAGTDAWSLQDALGRHLGDVARVAADTFVIKAGPLLPDLHTGPFSSLDLAMSEIDRETHGTCELREAM